MMEMVRQLLHQQLLDPHANDPIILALELDPTRPRLLHHLNSNLDQKAEQSMFEHLMLQVISSAWQGLSNQSFLILVMVIGLSKTPALVAFFNTEDINAC
jgi:hypothetical protein